jgi:hypothetical protein
MSIPNSTSDIEILSGEEYSYVLVDPGVFKNIEGFSYGKVLVLDLEDEDMENVKVSLVRSGIFDVFDTELVAELPREYVSSNLVTQAEALDGSRSLVGAHACKVIEVHSGNRLWLYGTISDCEWDEKDSMATFYFAISEDEPLVAVRCSAGSWLVLDIYNFALRLFHKASGALYRLPLVTDKHRQLTDCITGFGNQKWDADHNLKKISDIMSLHRSFAAWTRLPIYDFKSGSVFWRSTQRCMDHYYYSQQSRSRPKKLPRSLLEQTPEEVTTSKKRRAKEAVGTTPKRPRTRLDISTTPATGYMDVDSEDGLEAAALANTVIPETAIPDIYAEAVEGRHTLPDPRSVHPAASLTNPTVGSHGPSTSTSVVLPANQNLLVDYLREFKDEKDKAICKMSKTQLKLFGLISNGKCVNGVPYSDPTQFLSALCSFSRDLGVIYYPTKCKGIFSFDFGQSVFIEEFGYLGWMEMSAQCKLIDMTDFSPKAKRPTLPKLSTIADLLACVDNLLNLSIRIFKPVVVDEITRLKAFLHRNQNEIKERVQQSPAIVERLADWTNDMLRRLRMGFEADTSEMMNEYRTRLHVNASEYAHVMTSAMWDSIASIKSIHHASEGIAIASDGSRKKGKRDNVKDRIARFQIIRKAIPAHGGKKVCFQNLTAKGCSGGAATCFKTGFCHFVPKKSDIPADALTALETTFGALRSELK